MGIFVHILSGSQILCLDIQFYQIIHCNFPFQVIIKLLQWQTTRKTKENFILLYNGNDFYENERLKYQMGGVNYYEL